MANATDPPLGDRPVEATEFREFAIEWSIETVCAVVAILEPDSSKRAPLRFEGCKRVNALAKPEGRGTAALVRATIGWAAERLMSTGGT